VVFSTSLPSGSASTAQVKDWAAVWDEGYTAEKLHDDVRSNWTVTSGRRNGGYR
jgi:hypothetical protein